MSSLKRYYGMRGTIRLASRAMRLWGACALSLALIASLFIQSYTHGPGAYAAMAQISAEIESHGHSHDFGTHNSADHDHQTAEAADLDPHRLPERFEPPRLIPASSSLPDGRAIEGLRRPPRHDVI